MPNLSATQLTYNNTKGYASEDWCQPTEFFVWTGIVVRGYWTSEETKRRSNSHPITLLKLLYQTQLHQKRQVEVAELKVYET